MNPVKRWIIKEVLLHKLKALFGGLVQTNTSEFWALWGTAIVGTVVHFFPQAATMLDWLSSFGGFPSGAAMVSALLAGAFTYGVGRMTSKAAKAQPSEAAQDAAAARRD